MKIISEIRCCYLMLLPLPQGGPLPPSQFLPCSEGHLFWLQLKKLTFYSVILTILQFDYRRSSFTISRCAFRQKCRFYSPFLYIGDKNVFMINMFITNGMYLSFCFVLHEATNGYMQCRFISSMIWRFL